MCSREQSLAARVFSSQETVYVTFSAWFETNRLGCNWDDLKRSGIFPYSLQPSTRLCCRLEPELFLNDVYPICTSPRLERSSISFMSNQIDTFRSCPCWSRSRVSNRERYGIPPRPCGRARRRAVAITRRKFCSLNSGAESDLPAGKIDLANTYAQTV